MLHTSSFIRISQKIAIFVYNFNKNYRNVINTQLVIHNRAQVLQSDDIITQNEDLEKHISLKIVKLHKKVRGLHQGN